MRSITVMKIGGNVIDNPESLKGFLREFAAIEGPKILVHGGGKLATRLAERLELKVRMVDGRRITDKGTLDVVTMVYAGLVNKQIVAGLQAVGCNALGLSGADGNIVTANGSGYLEFTRECLLALEADTPEQIAASYAFNKHGFYQE